MKESEVADLLGFAASFDQRTIGAEDVDAWCRALAGIEDAELCQEAVVAHYRESDLPVRPAHIIRRVRSISSALPSALSVNMVLPPAPSARADVAGPAMVREAMSQAHEENLARRDLILAHPDLAQQLSKHLLLGRPDSWSGRIPSENPERDALLHLVRQASARAQASG